MIKEIKKAYENQQWEQIQELLTQKKDWFKLEIEDEMIVPYLFKKPLIGDELRQFIIDQTPISFLKKNSNGFLFKRTQNFRLCF